MNKEIKLWHKPIREIGMVISKKINEAREAGTSLDGTRKWDARPQEFIIEVVSCDEDDFDLDKGIFNGTRAEYKVDEATYKKVKFGDWANVKYTASQFADKLTIKPESFSVRKKEIKESK